MNGRRVRTLIGKEWAETMRNRSIVLSFLLMLLLFTGLPLGLALGLPALLGEEIANDPDTDKVIELLRESFPQFGALDPIEQFQVFMLRQFIPLYLLLPVMSSMSISTYSIIGEKNSRSLEALLATPIRTDELLLAKSVAAALPGVLLTWVAFGILAAATYVASGPQVFRYALDAAAWGSLVLLTPLIAFFGLGLGIIVSSRVNDARSAQQWGGLLVLPIVALMIGQTSGLFLLGLPLVIVAAAVLLLLDLGVLALGVSLFNREAILTRWR